MRRRALFLLPVMSGSLLCGCTGTGVFFDHTTQWFSRNPNMPAGSSETFLRIRGEPVDIPPLLPETGNVWPANSGPDLSLQEVQKRQEEEIRRNGGQPVRGGPTVSPQGGPVSSSMPPPAGSPAVNRGNAVDRGLPPPAPQPGAPRSRPTVQTPNGPAVDVNPGSGQGYRQLQTPGSPGTGILVPNGNGTSTLIGPDGSVQTVPTRQ